MSLKIMKKLTCSSCLTSDLYMFTTQFDDICTRNNVEDAELLNMNEALKNAGNRLKDDMKNIRVNPNTAWLQTCKTKRRNSYHSFLEFLEGLADSEFDPVKRNAALSLLAIFDKYGHKLERASTNKFTSAMDIILSELAKPQAVQHITDLQAQPFVNDLKETNKNAKNAYMEKIEFNAKQYTPDVIADRDDASQMITTLISYLETNERKSPGKYGLVPRVVNEVIVDIMTQVHARATRADDDGGEPEVPAPDGEEQPDQPANA